MPRSLPNENQHSRVRDDHATEVAEDYVEAIAEIVAGGGSCRGVDLVKRFAVSHVTVNRTIGRLQRDGFVTTEPYKPIQLTNKGKRLAERAKQRHEIVLEFLIAIGVSHATAVVDSEGLEHHVSDETLNAMQRVIASK